MGWRQFQSFHAVDERLSREWLFHRDEGAGEGRWSGPACRQLRHPEVPDLVAVTAGPTNGRAASEENFGLAAGQQVHAHAPVWLGLIREGRHEAAIRRPRGHVADHAVAVEARALGLGLVPFLALLEEVLALAGECHIARRGHVVIGGPVQEPVVRGSSPDAEDVDDVRVLVGGRDEHQQSPVCIESLDVRVRAPAVGLHHADAVHVREVGEQVPVCVLVRLPRSVDRDEVVADRAHAQGAEFRVRVSDVAEHLTALREENEIEVVVVRVAVAAGEVELRLHLVGSAPASERGMAVPGKDGGDGLCSRLVPSAVGPCVVNGADAAVGEAHNRGSVPRFGKERYVFVGIEGIETAAGLLVDVARRVGVALEFREPGP